MCSFECLNFLKNLSHSLIFSAISPSNHSFILFLIRKDFIGAISLMTFSRVSKKFKYALFASE